jgi:hypothetical protein
MQLVVAALVARPLVVRRRPLLQQATSQQPVVQVARLAGARVAQRAAVLGATEHCSMLHTGLAAAVGETLSLEERAALPATAVLALGAEPLRLATRRRRQAQTVVS